MENEKTIITKEYDQEIDHLDKHRMESMKVIEKITLTINLGFFGFSLAFVFKFIELKCFTWAFCLYGSWILMATALFVGLYVQKQIIKAIDKRYDFAGEKFNSKQTEQDALQKEEQRNSVWAKDTKTINYLQKAHFILTFLSIILMLSFVVKSISSQSKIIAEKETIMLKKTNDPNKTGQRRIIEKSTIPLDPRQSAVTPAKPKPIKEQTPKEPKNESKS